MGSEDNIPRRNMRSFWEIYREMSYTRVQYTLCTVIKRSIGSWIFERKLPSRVLLTLNGAVTTTSCCWHSAVHLWFSVDWQQQPTLQLHSGGLSNVSTRHMAITRRWAAVVSRAAKHSSVGAEDSVIESWSQLAGTPPRVCDVAYDALVCTTWLAHHNGRRHEWDITAEPASSANY